MSSKNPPGDRQPQDAATASDQKDDAGRLFDVLRGNMATLAEALVANTAAITALADRFGELQVSAPRTSGANAAPLTREEIDAILKRRPQASFRFLQSWSFGGFTREVGAIIRPQVTAPNIWQALLSQRVKLQDADENP